MKNNEVLVKVEKREVSTKSAVKQAREKGFIPACIYGKEIKDSINILISEKEAEKLIKNYGENHPIKIDVDGKKIEAIIKDFQYHLISNKILHLDFFAVSSSKVIKTHIPIVFEGVSKGEKAGGVVEKLHQSIEVEGKISDLPDNFKILLENYDVGARFHVKDLSLPANIKAITNPDEVIFIILGKKEETAEATAEGAMTAEEAEKAKEIFD